MTDWSPPSVPRPWLAVLAVLYVCFGAYAVLIAGQLLLVVIPTFSLLGLYLLWRFIVAVEAIADAQQRLADRRTNPGAHRTPDDPEDDG